MKKTFTEIYEKNRWRDSESRSGPGSNLANTEAIRAALPNVLKEMGIRSVLDIPCGDFYWMKEMQTDLDMYIGADIVKRIVDDNTVKYSGDKRRFMVLDIARDALPAVDLVFCRDCFVHFSFDDIRRAFRNLKRSGSRYLLTTTFTDTGENRDIVTGKWRPLNLQKAPFHLPEPIMIIYENYTGEDGRYGDKSLGLWNIRDIAW